MPAEYWWVCIGLDPKGVGWGVEDKVGQGRVYRIGIQDLKSWKEPWEMK